MRFIKVRHYDKHTYHSAMPMYRLVSEGAFLAEDGRMLQYYLPLVSTLAMDGDLIEFEENVEGFSNNVQRVFEVHRDGTEAPIFTLIKRGH